jgi:hypothetical protein
MHICSQDNDYIVISTKVSLRELKVSFFPQHSREITTFGMNHDQIQTWPALSLDVSSCQI